VLTTRPCELASNGSKNLLLNFGTLFGVSNHGSDANTQVGRDALPAERDICDALETKKRAAQSKKLSGQLGKTFVSQQSQSICVGPLIQNY
jgi:hypothetical protein